MFFRAHDTELVGKWYGAAFGANGIELSHLVEFTKNLFLPLLAFALILVFTETMRANVTRNLMSCPVAMNLGWG